MTDTDYIRRTFELARRGMALTSPGAMAGAIVVKDGRIVGEGFYTWDEIDHAETRALRQAGSDARDATVYISLEPCAHQGRTPPCAKGLIQSGVSRVVAAIADPNPEVNGKGFAMLREAGIAVQSGILEEEAHKLNEAHFTYKTQKRPFGILKIAMSLDGKIATHTGDSKWITSEQARTVVQEMRFTSDAVVTGSGTFLKDSPQMTDRSGKPRRRELIRVVLDRRGQLDSPEGWLTFRGSLEELAKELYSREIQSFLMECGPDLAFNAIQSGIIDKIIAFVAPKILGGREIPAIGGSGVASLADAIPLYDGSIGTAGPDLIVSGYVHRNH